jgi:hypothetical protein
MKGCGGHASDVSTSCLFRKAKKEHETICRYVTKQSLETQFTDSWCLKKIVEFSHFAVIFLFTVGVTLQLGLLLANAIDCLLDC